MNPTSIDAILTDPQSVQPLYQPIVDLTTETVIGYEALARWPQHPDADPATVFATAAEHGTSDALDWACRTAAITGALDADMAGDLALFVNIEPLSQRTAPAYARSCVHAHAQLNIVIELTERSLLDDPAKLLDTVRQARRSGCLIALDDVGSHPDSLALLDFVAPDIIKLDCALVQCDPSPQQAAVLIAIAAHVESTGHWSWQRGSKPAIICSAPAHWGPLSGRAGCSAARHRYHRAPNCRSRAASSARTIIGLLLRL